MNILHVSFDEIATPLTLHQRLQEAREVGARSVLVLAGDGVEWPAATIDPWLQGLGVPVFGGVFPEVVHGTLHSPTGLVTVSLADVVPLVVVSGLDQTSTDYGAALAALPDETPSLLVLVDGLAPYIARFVESVFDQVGGGPFVVGGGAGSLSFQSRPCLFTPAGMRANAALVASLPQPLGIGVDHGWEPVDGPFLVTQSKGNRILQLNYRPAAEIYRQCVEPRVGEALTPENFFGHAKAYPFGMVRPDGSLLVRDPIVMDGGELVCVGEVPVQTAVHVLRGSDQNLIDAAARGAASAVRALGAPPAGGLLIDCISRVLFLGERFTEELAAVQDSLQGADATARPPFGALTLGEIANNGTHCLEFYNKTFVLGAFGHA